MKKLSLLAAALVVAGAAHAQIANPNIGATPGPNGLALPTGPIPAAPSNFTRNISTIEQVGTSQYGTVSQSGDQSVIQGRQNEASLRQISSNAAAGQNNASQPQVNDASGGGSTTASDRAANRMEAEQRGTRSTVTQSQQGSGNRASAFQREGSTENYILQNQFGVDNSAYSEQRGSFSRSEQRQNGQRNQAVVIQTSPSDFNLAVQDQTGSDNRARIGQGTQDGTGSPFDFGYNDASQAQNGINNFANTDQFGADDLSRVTQTGNSNTAVTTQR